MLSIFKRHTPACKKAHADAHSPEGRDMGRKYRRCDCPLHCEGKLGPEMIRKALDTNSWTRAQAIIREKEAAGVWEAPGQQEAITITQAVTAYRDTHGTPSTASRIRFILVGVDADYEAKGGKARTMAQGLLDFCAEHGYTRLEQLTLPVLNRLAGTWKCGARHRIRRIHMLRSFFRFCMASKWVTDNPAAHLVIPKGTEAEAKAKVPFDANYLPQHGPEMQSMLDYCDRARGHRFGKREQLKALILLMRHTGLRISDAVMFNRNRIMQDGSIFLYMAKTKQPVTLPMHPEIATALAGLTPNAQGYYFVSGAGKCTSFCSGWRSRFRRMFIACGIEGGHPHRFRHTFAVDLLLRGVDIHDVQAALGHWSVTMTEKHYLSFVAARRAQLADSLKRAWAWQAPGPVAVPAVQGRKRKAKAQGVAA